MVNAYDNAIRYTDHFLAQTICGWASSPGVPRCCMSDHGESLGENNLYLHGLPYALAPDEQKQVAMLAWLSEPAAAHRAEPCLPEPACQATTDTTTYSTAYWG